MTIIRTTCECCGDVEMPAWAATVTLTDLAEGFLQFSCPECGGSDEVQADAASVALLRVAGVPVTAPDDTIEDYAGEFDEEYIIQACAYLSTFDTLCDHHALLG
ncbi:MAG: hypothetical protein EBS41_02840 [Actinobacteria bacterium]|nr:hypothetical protein [Actinomycetota bacterium]